MFLLNISLAVVVRALIAFATLLIFTRILGKQEISRITFFDFVAAITMGSIAASLTVDLSTEAWAHWIGLFTWASITLFLQWVTMKSRYALKYIDDEPTVLIMNGQIMEDAMRKARFRLDDLTEHLRQKSVFDVSQVEFAVLERDGKVSVLKKSQHQPVTPGDLKIPTSYKGMNTELIYDGQVLDQNLQHVDRDRSWLKAELDKLGINDFSEVFLAAMDTSGNLYVDKYRDTVKNITDISDYKGPN